VHYTGAPGGAILANPKGQVRAGLLIWRALAKHETRFGRQFSKASTGVSEYVRQIERGNASTE
jgi:hypothetical protein